MWEGEMGRNPALGAPGSNNYTGLIASSTSREIGASSRKLQALTDEVANDTNRSLTRLPEAIAVRALT